MSKLHGSKTTKDASHHNACLSAQAMRNSSCYVTCRYAMPLEHSTKSKLESGNSAASASCRMNSTSALPVNALSLGRACRHNSILCHIIKC